MSDATDDLNLPRAPRDPADFLGIGIVLAVIGGIVAAFGEGGVGFGVLVATIGVLVGSIGGVLFFIGAVGQGVLLALRRNRYEVELQRIIDGVDER